MHKTFLAIVFLFSTICSFAQKDNATIINYDIANFWEAYDQIITTTDREMQLEMINKLYIEPGSPGLKALMEVRQYTADSYIDAINSYPLFWESVRKNTLKTGAFTKAIGMELVKLKNLYPALKPAKMYFTIGALRTNGTTRDGKVLIGSELALTDKNTVSSEFPPGIKENRRKFFDSNPIENVVLLNVHEYVHTQQKPIVHNLLSQCLYEGVAEFVSVIATGKPSVVPAVAYGKANEAKVKKRFEEDMFNILKGNLWLWSDAVNEFNQRDLGYYIGYAMCEIYYNKATDKKKAIADLIELDYNNEKQIEQFVDGTKFFSTPISKLEAEFEKKRPYVKSISQFVNGSKKVDPKLTQITLNFSAPMDINSRGFDFGPLGEEAVLRVKNFIGFSEDAKSATFEVELQPNKKYQTLVTNRFRDREGVPLKGYLIEMETGE